MSKPWFFTSMKQHQIPPQQTQKHISITAMNYSSLNTSVLGAAYDEGSVALWDANKELVSCAYKTHTLPCTSISLSPVSSILMVSGGIDGLIVLYDLNSKKSIKTIDASKTGISSLDMFKNGYTLSVGTLDGYVHMFDLRHCDEPYKSLKAHETSINCIKFLQNSNNQHIHSMSSINNSSTNSLNNLDSTLQLRNLNGNSLQFSANSNEFISPLANNAQTSIKKSSNFFLIRFN